MNIFDRYDRQTEAQRQRDEDRAEALERESESEPLLYPHDYSGEPEWPQ